MTLEKNAQAGTLVGQASFGSDRLDEARQRSMYLSRDVDIWFVFSFTQTKVKLSWKGLESKQKIW
jgi:hypothetical protein